MIADEVLADDTVETDSEVRIEEKHNLGRKNNEIM